MDHFIPLSHLISLHVTKKEKVHVRKMHREAIRSEIYDHKAALAPVVLHVRAEHR